MPFPLRCILTAFGICSALLACAKTPSDTIVKKMTVPLTRSSIQAIDKINGINQGVQAIRADSVEKGIHQIAAGIDQSLALSKLDRVLDYNEMEYIALLKILDSDGLSVPERQLGFELYKIVIKEGAEPTEKNLSTYLKSAPNTLFVKRIRLMIHSNEGDSKMPSLLNSVLKEQPGLLPLNILQAEYYFNRNKFEAAIPYLDKAITLSPAYAYAYNLRARCLGNLDKYDQQIKDEDKAITYFPNYTEAYYYRASAFEQLQQYRDAATAYLEVVRRSPGYQYTNYSIARCYKAINILDSALYYVNDYIRQDANDADGYYLKGDIYYDKDDYPAAVKCFDQAAGLDPKNAGIYQDRGNAYFYWGKLDTAMTDFVKSASLDKKNPYPLERIGDCYYNMKDYDKSIIYHQKALHVDPQYKYALVSIGLCYDRMEKHALAADIYRKAISIDSTYGIALGNFGWENYCIGHFDECISWSYKALQQDTAATYAMFNIALATLRKGEFEKAKDLYIHFITLCKEKNYEMTGGAQGDLRDLIKNKIFADQATSILKDVFHEEP
jgi:tetratricopeptide (TPR) repeat protein